MLRGDLLCTFALTTRAVMHDLMGKEITVNAKVAMTCGAFITTAHAHSLGLVLCDLPLIL